ADDWCGGIAEGSVELSEINEAAAAAGTAEKLEEVKAGFADGSIKVFDVSTFTVDGVTLDSYQADVDTDDAYTPDTEVIKDGYFHESEYRSAPYFDLKIDGIELLNEKY
ncbi:MAG: BMP family ABC transporter substrate-binding protein, partial [Clostridia bacterium]|nr:BMP family ABC transporter substrate-binding protein [Clostridia bacterium]